MQIFRYLFFIQLVFIVTKLSAQVEEKAGKIINDGYPGGIVEAINLEKTSVIEGSFFINYDWSVGNVLLYNGNAINGMPLKYNLRDEMLILLDHNKITRVLRDDQIKEFNWFDINKKKNILFINCKNYKLNNTPMVGVMQVLSEGKVELLLYRDLALQKGFYSVTHDAGQRNDEYVINEYLYLASDNNLYEVKNKKALLDYVGEDSEKINSYIKKQKLKIKDPEDLAEIVDYYNSLL